MTAAQYQHAIIRGVPDSFDSCIKPDDRAVIDVTLARKQHDAYRDVLRALSVELHAIAADERYPDCCFVEDTAIVIGDNAFVLHMGAPSRIGEESEVRKHVSKHKCVRELSLPAKIDGGDVLQAGKKIFVGLSLRTNSQAVSVLAEHLSPDGYEVIPVPIRNILHLKSACSYLGNDCVLLCRGFFDEQLMSGYDKIIVDPEEAYSANCLAVNGRVVVSQGFPRMRSRVEAAGFDTIELDMSEFKKAGGSLTCLSILF